MDLTSHLLQLFIPKGTGSWESCFTFGIFLVGGGTGGRLQVLSGNFVVLEEAENQTQRSWHLYLAWHICFAMHCFPAKKIFYCLQTRTQVQIDVAAA